ncbi:MAG TPA: type I-E CRISPR-associated protein Cas5/CasD [Pyrinomonadaceae bacterium]|nr:type I-E CRISPR-associated protein Cas5/CasD [Pyrinomonadaceae bacterium]HMP66290.1 type I-E CRISPR-associated protein Cas5/CasD [Pyrinomonadaceae bacterium]
MSHILFMRLAGPMQSWGVKSRFSRRDTGKEPSKSGVIGLICAAMGIDRDNDSHPDFIGLQKTRLGIRVLRGGNMESDYHTARDVAIADAKQKKDRTFTTKDTELSTRFYLADADFIVALESDDRDLLERVHAALKRPKWQLFLGRKAFVPSVPVFVRDELAIVEGSDILSALSDDSLIERLCLSDPHRPFDVRQRIVIEDPENGSEIRQDVPLSFVDRRFTIRRVRTTFATNSGGENNVSIP